MTENGSLYSVHLSKCWQSSSGELVFQASIWCSDTRKRTKRYLIIDPKHKTNVLVLSSEKPQHASNANGMAAMIRKHCPTVQLKALALRNETEDQDFLRLEFALSTWDKLIYLVIRTSPHAETEFIVDGISLARLTTKGLYTVKKQAQPDIMVTDNLDQNQFQFWLKSLVEQEGAVSDNNSHKQTINFARREARDKVARRLKTLKKTRSQDLGKLPAEQDIINARDEARLLSNFLWAISANSEEIRLDPSQTGSISKVIKLDPKRSPGENLDDLYFKIKKLERAKSLQTDRLEKISKQIIDYEVALTNLRDASIDLTERDVNQILQKLGLSASTLKASNTLIEKKFPKTLGRRFQAADQFILTLGRDASECDKIVKLAKSNDWWVHISGGGTGTHVIISARSPKQPLPDVVLRQAGILALHFSDRSQSKEGEVYCTKKQNIKKTKGLPPGLWLVEKSDTHVIRYDESEVKDIFKKEIRDGLQRHKVGTP